jgi:surface carbohydrate biosynthesis protein (TIGR04326 family)
MPSTPPASAVHLVERVRSPEPFYEALRAPASPDALVLDLSAGRLDGVSRLDAARMPEDGGFERLQAADFAGAFAETTRDTYVQWVGDVAEQELVDGKSIRELFTYEGELSLWWITQTAEKDQDHSPYRWFFFAFAVIDHLLETGRVGSEAEWHLWVPDSHTGEVLRHAVGERGRVVVHVGAGRAEQGGIKARLGRALTRLNRTVVWPARQILGAFQAGAADRQRRTRGEAEGVFGGRPKVLVVTEYPHSWSAVGDEERFSEAVSAYDRYFGTMPWDLRERGAGVAWVASRSTRQGYARWRDEGRTVQDLPDASPWAYLDFAAVRTLLRNQARWVRAYRRLFVEQRVQDRIRHGRIPMGHWIARDYANLCGGWAVALLIKYEQFRRAARELRPDAVLYRDEMYVSGRVVSAAMKDEARLVGIQHGIIHADATVYCFDRREVEGGAGPPDHVGTCPVPDVFASFGEHTKELFERLQGYDASRVVPAGGVRHDDLTQRFPSDGEERARLRGHLRKTLGLPLDSRVVLLCTQRAAVAGQWFEMIVRGLKGWGDDVFVAVKTHPYHGGEERIRAVAEEEEWERYSLFDAATYPLIYCSDAVVGGASTIILESCLLGTPAISIAGAGDHEVYPYVQDRVGEAASDEATMRAHLKEILAGEAHEDAGFQVRRREILRRHLWNDDAGACGRLYEVITSDGIEG